MSDERDSFEQTRARLEEILVQVRRKDTSLEQSLGMLEEGVRLANRCNELIDQTSWRASAGEDAERPDEDAAVVGLAGEGEDEPVGADALAGDGEEGADTAEDVGDTGREPAELPDDERS
jgi:exodeoxyribonuclease VII small subunit